MTGPSLQKHERDIKQLERHQEERVMQVSRLTKKLSELTQQLQSTKDYVSQKFQNIIDLVHNKPASEKSAQSEIVHQSWPWWWMTFSKSLDEAESSGSLFDESLSDEQDIDHSLVAVTNQNTELKEKLLKTEADKCELEESLTKYQDHIRTLRDCLEEAELKLVNSEIDKCVFRTCLIEQHDELVTVRKHSQEVEMKKMKMEKSKLKLVLSLMDMERDKCELKRSLTEYQRDKCELKRSLTEYQRDKCELKRSLTECQDQLKIASGRLSLLGWSYENVEEPGGLDGTKRYYS